LSYVVFLLSLYISGKQNILGYWLFGKLQNKNQLTHKKPNGLQIQSAIRYCQYLLSAFFARNVNNVSAIIIKKHKEYHAISSFQPHEYPS
jgi:uncharacterized membrane protein